MAIEFENNLINGLRFGLDPKRWLPFFIVDFVFILSGLMIFIENISAFSSLLSGNFQVFVQGIVGTIGVVVVLILIWWLLKLWVTGAIIRQSHKEKEFTQSFLFAKNKYLSLLVTAIILAIIGGAVGSVPLIGWLLALIVSIVLIFTLQAIIVKGFPFDNAIMDSYRLFRKEPFNVFLVWLVTFVVSGIISFIFLLPLLAMFIGTLGQIANTSGNDVNALLIILQQLQTNLPALVASVTVFLVGVAVASAFKLKFITDSYIQLKMKKFSV